MSIFPGETSPVSQATLHGTALSKPNQKGERRGQADACRPAGHQLLRESSLFSSRLTLVFFR